MDNRNGWASFEQKMGAAVQMVVDKMEDGVMRYYHLGVEISEDRYRELYNTLDKMEEEVHGVKHDFNKPQMSLLPMGDLEGVARVLEYGVEKYARGDWKYVEDGAFRYLDAALRHAGELTDATTTKELQVLDHESGLPAIDHAICSLIFARHFIFKEADSGGE